MIYDVPLLHELDQAVAGLERVREALDGQAEPDEVLWQAVASRLDRIAELTWAIMEAMAKDHPTASRAS